MPATALTLAPDRAGPRAFLGVERSVCGRSWRDRLDERAATRALAIVQRHGIPELLARILAGRGVEIDAVEGFLDPSIRRLMPDPHVVTGMETAAARIADAVMCGERIAIFGDYDVDGATSAALLARFLRHAGLAPEIYIPDRLFEGYGPNVEAVQMLAQKGARLLVTVDCGTTSLDALAEAQRVGLETIVIDHHQADAQLPPAVLSAVGQVFGGTSPFGAPLVAGQISQAPELVARGLPGGNGNLDIGFHTGGGIAFRLTRDLSFGADIRYNRIAGSNGSFTTYGSRISLHF